MEEDMYNMANELNGVMYNALLLLPIRSSMVQCKTFLNASVVLNLVNPKNLSISKAERKT
jgi:hypothetical protein